MRKFTAVTILIVTVILCCNACQRGLHETAGARKPLPNETPAYTVSADYNQSPATK